MVGNSKVVPFNAAQRRAERPRTRTRKAENKSVASGPSVWLNATATNGLVLLVAALTIVIVVVLVAALVKPSAGPRSAVEVPSEYTEFFSE